MSIFQGNALPSVTTTQTAQQTAPEYFTNYLSNLAQFGQQQLGVPGQNLVAGPSALQTQAFQQAPGTLMGYQAPLGAAQSALGQLATGVGEKDISQFYNPFESKVMDEMSRRSAQNVERNLLPQMKAAFVGSGGLGGQRYAGATAQALSDVQADLLGKQASMGAAGYQQALDAAMKQKGLMGSAAQIGGQLASQTGALGTGALTAMSQLGAQQQAIEQAKINAPMLQAQNVAQLLRGFAIPTGATQTTVRPGQQGEFGLSPLSQIGTLGGLIGSVVRPEGNLSYISDFLKNLFTSNPSTWSNPNTSPSYGGGTIPGYAHGGEVEG